MHKSKSVLLLSTFTDEEISRFGEFLHSPYFNKNSRVIDVFDEIKKDHPDYLSKNISKEKLYGKLFRGKPYNDQVIKNLNTQLLKLAKDFLSIDKFCQDSFEKKMMLITNLTHRKTNMLFEKESRILSDIARENRTEIKDLYLLLNRIEEERFTNALVNNRQAESTQHIIKSGEYLILFFLKNILRLSINYRINEFSFNASAEVNLMAEFIRNTNFDIIVSYMENNNIEHNIHIKLLYYALQCNLNINDTERYNHFKDLLFDSREKFTKNEFQHLLHLLESIIAQKINAGMLEYYRDLFETYDYELKNDLYKPNKTSPLTVMKYRNIYLSALKSGEFEWAEKFIRDYRNELQKKDRQSIESLSMAQLNFEKKNFEETLHHLQNVRTSQIFYKIDVKILSLMALYELSHTETALSAIESFKKLLAANTSLTGQYRDKNRNFSLILTSIIKARGGNKELLKEEILKRISQTAQLANRKWLISKAEELK